MAQSCTMYFFIKTCLPKPPAAKPMHTVIWKLDAPDSSTAPTKTLEINLSKPLLTGGIMGKDLVYEVFPITTPGKTQPQVEAMMADPTFTWKDDAITISLHSVTVTPTGEVLANPFCKPTI